MDGNVVADGTAGCASDGCAVGAVGRPMSIYICPNDGTIVPSGKHCDRCGDGQGGSGA